MREKRLSLLPINSKFARAFTVISVIMTDNEKLADEYKSDLDAWLKVKGLAHVD